MFTMSEDHARELKRIWEYIDVEKLNHNRLKHIKEIIEGPKDPRPGGIPRPEDHVQYLTIHIVTRAPKYIITKASDCKEEIKWGDPNESYV